MTRGIGSCWNWRGAAAKRAFRRLYAELYDPVTAWLLGMARHAVIDHQRRQAAFGGARQAAALTDELHDVIASDVADPLGTLIRDEEIRAVRAWLRRQDAPTRELLDLPDGRRQIRVEVTKEAP